MRRVIPIVVPMMHFCKGFHVNSLQLLLNKKLFPSFPEIQLILYLSFGEGWLCHTKDKIAFWALVCEFSKK